MRNAFARALFDAAMHDERIYVLAADISPAGPLIQFAKAFPRRFINVGVAEQAMIGMAAGLALKGLRPFCYTIATFALYRTFEFIRDDLAYQQLPVTVVGMGAGLNYSTLGATHHAIEDVAIAAAIPGMRVLAPYDPKSTAIAVETAAVAVGGPTYLRLGKAGEPNLKFSPKPGVCFIGYGPILGQFQDFQCFPLTKLKPFPKDEVLWALSNFKHVAVVEEHTPWLGPLVKSMAHEYRSPTYVHSFALKDEFIHFHGEREELLRLHELTRDQVVAKLRQKVDISQHLRGDRSPETQVSASEPRSLTHAERR